ncbi:MAG: D-tyrosyl-tRNA(Tyr) deacylase [Deltaproteobacteria bacterium]|nr:D-tyrosyl-tRNA(Tyr) deacylase [Deltaproteobacteria bacterium]
MRAVVQRVRRASVDVGEQRLVSMGEGVLAFVGVGHRDGPRDASELAKKIVGLRIFEDESGRMNRSLLEVGGSLGLVSQFTLWADARKGRRPSFGDAAEPAVAEPIFESVVEAARQFGVPVVTGRFGATMDVSLVNAGPVTILLDTERVF